MRYPIAGIVMGAAATAALLALTVWAGAATAQTQVSPWPPLDRPTTATNEGRIDVAVIVAIGRYSELPGIDGAVANGRAWERYFITTRGIPPARVRLLEDRRATKELIVSRLADASRRVRQGGTLWFVFIGHGAPAKDGDGLLVGADALMEPDSFAARSVRRSELSSVLRKGRQKRAVVVLDACFSGRSTKGEPLLRGLQPLMAAQPWRAKSATILSAARADQFAGPLPGARRPAFSYLLLGGLRGWADGWVGDQDTQRRDGNVTPVELAAYAKGTLRTFDVAQDPELAGDGADQPLSRGREAGPDLLRIRRRLRGQPEPARASPSKPRVEPAPRPTRTAPAGQLVPPGPIGPAPAPPEPGRRVSTAGIVMASAGAVGLLTFAVYADSFFGGKTFFQCPDVTVTCTDPDPQYKTAAEDAAAEYNAERVLAGLGLLTGVVAGGIGAYILLSDDDDVASSKLGGGSRAAAALLPPIGFGREAVRFNLP